MKVRGIALAPEEKARLLAEAKAMQDAGDFEGAVKTITRAWPENFFRIVDK